MAADILAAALAWARVYDPALHDAVAAEPELAQRALAIERVGLANPRKDRASGRTSGGSTATSSSGPPSIPATSAG